MRGAWNTILENKGRKIETQQLGPGVEVAEWSLRPILSLSRRGGSRKWWKSQGGSCFMESSAERQRQAGQDTGVEKFSLEAEDVSGYRTYCGWGLSEDTSRALRWEERVERKMEKRAAETAYELKKRICPALSSLEKVEVCLLWQIVPNPLCWAKILDYLNCLPWEIRRFPGSLLSKCPVRLLNLWSSFDETVRLSQQVTRDPPHTHTDPLSSHPWTWSFPV